MSKVSSANPDADMVNGVAELCAPGMRPDETLLDDPQEWGAFGRACAGDSAWESHVVVEGMHCAACALTIEDALRAVPGVVGVEVSAATQRARVVWQPDQVLPSRWLTAVRAAGYSALPAMDAQARERRQREHRRALWRWLVAGFCMMQVMMYAWPAYVAQPGDLTGEMEQLLRWASWVITLPMVVFSCGPFFANALRCLRPDDRRCPAGGSRRGAGGRQCCHAPRARGLAAKPDSAVTVDGCGEKSGLPRLAGHGFAGPGAAPTRKPAGALALAGCGLLHDAGDDVCLPGLYRAAG